MKKRKIAAVIPTYNSIKTLKICLKSLIKQSYPVDQIIVVNNNSSDNTALEVKHSFPKVKLLNLSKNTGVTGGRNAGLAKVKKGFDYVLFFDHDMVAKDDMVVQLVGVAEKESSIGIVTPKIYYLSNQSRIWSAGTGINLYTGQVLFRGGKDNGQFDDLTEVQVAPAALLVKKEVISKIKKFDERYFATYEDTDFCFRAKRCGFKTFYAPLAIAYHDIPEDPLGEANRLLVRGYYVGRNRVLFMRDFARNYLIFLMFLPVYCLYYFLLACKHKNFKGWLNFMKGTFIGLVS